MKFTLTKFVLIGTFVGVVVAGVAGMEIMRFQQRNIEPQNIQQQTIDQGKLSAARDLTGIWTGTIEMSHAHPGEDPYCAYSGNLVLDLNQHGNTLAGTWLQTGIKVTHAKMTAGGPTPCGGGDQKVPINIKNGQVSGSSYSFIRGTGGFHISGSFTTDLLSGQFDEQIDGQTVGKGSFKLTRQKQ